jgi:uncharacterized protein (TIGR00255 family)
MIKSMTAFARTSQQEKWGNITWEVRAVNHRFLDCNFRLSENFRKLEPKLRELIGKHINRGRIECFLKYQPGEEAALDLSVNTSLVKKLATAINEVRENFDDKLSTINPMQILSWHNVLQIAEADSSIVNEKILSMFEATIIKLVSVKTKEGTALTKILKQKLKDLTSEVNNIKKMLPNVIEKERARILSRLKDIKGELDQTRLEQEMVYFAQRIDVEEEIDRLQTHIKEVTKALKQGGTVGKRLDFLMQELNREANTLASKSADKATTHAAIQLKVTIEQMREQVQNIE